MTRCQGTGGSADGERNLSAVRGLMRTRTCTEQHGTGEARHSVGWRCVSAPDSHGKGKEGKGEERGVGMLALSDVSRVGGHPDELCYVACQAVCARKRASRSVRPARSKYGQVVLETAVEAVTHRRW